MPIQNQGLQLPFGVQPVNPYPVDTWSGPFSATTLPAATADAVATIPISLRFPTMEVRLVVNGVGYKYWFRNGVNDSDLVEFVGGAGEQGATGVGTVGATGASGVVGFQGATGLRGATGASGLQGLVGSTGATGLDKELERQRRTTNFNALTGVYYLINTQSGSITATLPANPSVGSVIFFEDEASFWNTNNFVINPNGSPIEQITTNLICDISDSAFTLTFTSLPRGWKITPYNANFSLQGATGASGLRGTTGPIGATGASGLQGLRGTTGPIGATGASGIQGNIGATGASGLQGLQGATGASGLRGTTGPIGATGASGLQGNIGATGASGIQGNIGATGASGLQGNIGATGASGVVGFQGATGLRGTTGFTGATGASGLQGIQGVTGPEGPIGIDGQPGATGASGLQGNTGPIGATGASGLRGSTGLRGTTGFTGSTGPAGTSVTIEGSLALTPGNEITELNNVSNSWIPAVAGYGVIDSNTGDLWVYNGTTWDNVGEIRGPQGATGASGAPGNVGATGNTGATGVIEPLDSVLSTTSTNAVMNSAITSSLLVLVSAPTYTMPSVSLTNFTTTQYEIGSTVNQTLTINWSQQNAGSLIEAALRRNNVTIQTYTTLPTSFVVNEVATATGTTTYLVSARYNTGLVKNNILGFPDTRGQILSGAITGPGAGRSYSVFYRRWVGSHTSFITDPNQIRTLGLTTSLDNPSNTTFVVDTAPVFISNKFIYIVVPNTRVLTNVVTDANEILTTQFNVSNVQIRDAGNVFQSYKLYYLETAVPLNASIKTVTIANV